ncbi:MAG: hypothetical protein R3E18_01795 [Sphingomonadaceae bacterium]
MRNNFLLVERSSRRCQEAPGEGFLRLQLLIDKGYHPLAYRMMCLRERIIAASWNSAGMASQPR